MGKNKKKPNAKIRFCALHIHNHMKHTRVNCRYSDKGRNLRLQSKNQTKRKLSAVSFEFKPTSLWCDYNNLPHLLRILEFSNHYIHVYAYKYINTI